MRLTHSLVLNAQPREKTYRLFGRGLFVEIPPVGSKRWRIKYGRERRLSLGTFPAIALKAARERCMRVREQVAADVDPSAERKLAKLRRARKDESFEVIAREWFASVSKNWSPSSADGILRRLETYAFPWIGKVLIRELTAIDVLDCLRRVQQQNTHETARRILRSCNHILRYAII